MVKMLTRFAYLIVGLIELLLGFRFILKLFGASSAASFVNWVYQTTEPLLGPFTPAFPTPVIEGYVLEFTTLFALFVYAFVGYLMEEILFSLSRKKK